MRKPTRSTILWTVLALSLVAALALVACGGGAAPTEEEPEEEMAEEEEAPAEEEAAMAEEITVNVTLTDFVVEMDQTDIPSGATVTFNITNEGALEHELVLEPFGVVDEPLEADGEEVEVEAIQPGDTVSMTYTFEEDAAYQLACHVPGHYEAGMTQAFSVGGAEISEVAEAGGAMFGTGECEVRAVNLIGAWVDAGAPEGAFDFEAEDGSMCSGDFEADVLPLFTESGAWFEGSAACVGCHFAASEDSDHEMDLTSYEGILAGADVLEEPPGVSILGESEPGAGDFDWGESELRHRLRDNRMPPGFAFDPTEANRAGPTLDVNGTEVSAVDLLGAWVEAGAPETEPFGEYEATFEANVLPLFTESGAWFEGSAACVGCHFAASEDSAHEMDLTNYAGILAGADTLEDPPGESILGESEPGAGDFNWGESGLRHRLRNNRMPPGWEFDITEENRDGPSIMAGTAQ